MASAFIFLMLTDITQNKFTSPQHPPRRLLGRMPQQKDQQELEPFTRKLLATETQTSASYRKQQEDNIRTAAIA
jgi:hypothetical protein